MAGNDLSAVQRLLVILLALAAAAACSPPPERPVVSIAVGRNVWNGLTLLAERRGAFEQEGVEVDLVFQDAGKYCMDALVAGAVQMANVVEVNVAYLGYTENRDVRVIASVVESTSAGIVGRSDTIRVPGDLRGRILAFSPGTGGELFAYRFLANHQIPIAEVELRKIQPKGIPSALLGSAVDAASTWEPFIHSIVRGLNGEATVLRDPSAYTGYMFLAAREPWISSNRNTVAMVLRALRSAAESIQANPEAAIDDLAKELRLGRDLIADILPHFTLELEFPRQKMIGATSDVGALVKANQERLGAADLPDYAHYFEEEHFDGLDPL